LANFFVFHFHLLGDEIWLTNGLFPTEHISVKLDVKNDEQTRGVDISFSVTKYILKNKVGGHCKHYSDDLRKGHMEFINCSKKALKAEIYNNINCMIVGTFFDSEPQEIPHCKSAEQGSIISTILFQKMFHWSEKVGVFC